MSYECCSAVENIVDMNSVGTYTRPVEPVYTDRGVQKTTYASYRRGKKPTKKREQRGNYIAPALTQHNQLKLDTIRYADKDFSEGSCETYIGRVDGVVVYIGEGLLGRHKHLNSGHSHCLEANEHIGKIEVEVFICNNKIESRQMEHKLIGELDPIWNVRRKQLV